MLDCKHIGDNCYRGEYEGKKFTASVYDTPSKYGIDSGRVSKLCIKDTDNNWIVNYDRGWDVEPNDDIKVVYTYILNYLEDLDMKDYF